MGFIEFTYLLLSTLAVVCVALLVGLLYAWCRYRKKHALGRSAIKALVWFCVLFTLFWIIYLTPSSARWLYNKNERQRLQADYNQLWEFLSSNDIQSAYALTSWRFQREEGISGFQKVALNLKWWAKSDLGTIRINWSRDVAYIGPGDLQGGPEFRFVKEGSSWWLFDGQTAWYRD